MDHQGPWKEEFQETVLSTKNRVHRSTLALWGLALASLPWPQEHLFLLVLSSLTESDERVNPHGQGPAL